MSNASTVTPLKVVHKNLNSVLLVTLEFHQWSGRKKLEIKDLKVEEQDLPPQSLATLGAKKIIDLDLLRPFDALKKQAHRACQNSGVHFLSGYAIPLTKAEDVAAELNVIEEEYAKEKDVFLSKYNDHVEDWIKEAGPWGDIIRSGITASGYVEDAISFAWQAMRIAEPSGRGKVKDALSRGLNIQVNGMADQLFKEVAGAANDIIENSLQGRDRVTQKILNRVRQLRNKMHDLAFLDDRASPVVDMMDYTLSLLPKAGHLEGIHYMSLRGLMSMIADADAVREHGQSILNGQRVEEVVNNVVIAKIASASPAKAATGAKSQKVAQLGFDPDCVLA